MRYFRIGLLSLAAGLLALFLFTACTKTLDGEKFENQAPILWFVNIPPEDQTFSQNPVIYWVGQDSDGQVVSYRFAVIREDTMQSMLMGAPPPYTIEDIETFIQDLLLTMNDSVWTVLIVDPDAGEPKTSNIIPLKAELSDPVNTLVAQYLFVQAFDEEGAASQVIFRRFRRNDNPPQTFIRGFVPDLTKINSVQSFSAATGIRLRWEGQDRIDFPSDPPPFEFEWRLYGPYEFDSVSNNGIFEQLQRDFVKKVFRTNDARLFFFGINDTMFICRQELDQSGNLVEVCDTIPVDTISVNNALGVIDTLFNVNDSLFVNNLEFNKIAKQSFDGTDQWVSSLRDSIFDVFAKDTVDVLITRTRKFIFWIRARDDAQVPDLTPAFTSFLVVDPHYERNLLVIDAQKGFRVNASHRADGRLYWQNAISRWEQNTGVSVNYVDSIDYWVVSRAQGNVLPFEVLLSHKVAILVSDDSQKGSFPTLLPKLGTAITANVNMWVAARSPVYGGEVVEENFNVDIPPEYRTFFGIQGIVYSGWDWWYRFRIILGLPGIRIEDFIGATSLNTGLWPDLVVDTANLHSRYGWTTLLWVDSIAAYPEVDWFVRIPPTEPMYLYKSKFGLEHPLGLQHSFDGRPVMIRYNSGLFRTVHSLFSPYAFDDDAIQPLVENVLTWLFDGRLESGAGSVAGGERRSDGALDPAYSKRLLDNYWENRLQEVENAPPITYGISTKITP